MGQFSKAIAIALRYRLTILGIVATSMLVAVFWGANIGALYPIIKVALSEQSLQQWIEGEIAESKERIATLESQLRQLEGPRAAGASDELAQRRAAIQYELTVERRAMQASRRLQPWIERFLPRDPFQTVVWIVMALLAATAIKGVCIFANMMLVARLDQRVTFELRRQFFHQALRMDLASMGQQRTSGLLSHFHADIGNVTGGIKTLFGYALREPLKMIACLIGAAWVNWRLLLLSLVLTPLLALLVRQLAGSIKRANRRALEEVSALYGVLTEAFNGLQTVQAFTLEQSERNKFYRVSKACLKKGMRIALYSSLTKPVTELLGIAVISMALLAGAYLTLTGETHIGWLRMSDRPMSIASLLVFYGLLIGASEPSRKLSDVFSMIQAGVAAAERLFPLLERPPRITSPERPVPLPARIDGIRFQHVDFGYDPDRLVLRDIDIEIPAGETLAIVGPNGCGKSTLANLIPRFSDPTRGAVMMGGVDLRQLRLRELRRRIGIVTQRALLFDDTVRNNILCGRLDASESEVHEAARRARADRFIAEKLARGYDTVVGMGGERLSGGQRQRIALARALIRDPEILILDEATSQIDLESERLIQEALDEFARQRTVILITHRLATLALASRILVLNAGHIEDLGAHDELMGRCAVYRRLHEIQFQRAA